MSTDDDDLPFIAQVILFPIRLALIILFIAFTLITFGIFLPGDKEEKSVRSGTSSIKERLRIELSRKQNRLHQVRQRIGELQLIITKIKKSERMLLFWVRLTITSLIIGCNLLYLDQINFGLGSCQEIWEGHPGKDKGLSELIEIITNFNALILLIYSFPAYLLYGTVGRFTSAMKAKTTTILRRKHIPSFSELQFMRDEEKQLSQEITYLQMRLQELGWY